MSLAATIASATRLFRSLPTLPPALRKGELRALYECPAHPEYLGEHKGRCPVDGKDELEPSPLLDNQRVAWWCPMSWGSQ